MNSTLRLYSGEDAQNSPPPAILTHEPIADPRLNPRACQVFWALTYWAWGKKPDCWPGDSEIARLLKCDPRTVRRGLKQLEATGYITRRMIPSGRGWSRHIEITARKNQLTIHRPEVSTLDNDVHTPRTDVSTPPRTELSEEGSNKGKEQRMKPLASTSGSGAVASRPPGGREDQETSEEDLEFYRGLVLDRHADGRRFFLNTAISVLQEHDPAFLELHNVKLENKEKKPVGGKPASRPPNRPRT